MPLPTGARLGSYEVLSMLGVGGMGEVYRARDTRLGRDVAIKVLPAGVARDASRLERFTREARALAAIDHPNIVTVFSVEEASPGVGLETLHFLTMQLVEGQSLDHVIPEGGLPLERLLAIAAAIADALAAAHDKSIVHRDLKPANVMVAADGRVKVLDFGLAKDLKPSDPTDASLTSAGHTEYGVVLGTPAYMSPEQVAGKAVDHRSDIFSLGVLLYQMACGQRPFEGVSSIELASSILRDTPPPITDVRGDLPPDLARLIRRCLEKDPQRRVQTTRDVGNELREVAAAQLSQGRAPAPRTAVAGDSAAHRVDEGFRVAVLPFRYSGSNGDLAALAEGLSEEITTALSRYSYLRVIAHGSTLKYAKTSQDVREVGTALGARYVMEGSLRQAGTALRLAVQLTDTTTGTHLWAENFDRPFDATQVFAIQDQLVPRIVSTCADRFGVLAQSIGDVVRGRDVGQLTPYEALMRGFAYHHRLTPADHAEARDALERAVEQAPNNADCLAMLSWVYSHEFGHGFNPKPGSLDRALAAAQRAVDLAPSNQLAQQALALARFFRKETAACLSAAERALALNPLDGSNEAIFLITFTGDWERGCRLLRHAMDTNPHHPGWYRGVLAMDEYRQTHYQAAVEEAVKANVPGVFWTHVMLAASHGQLGDREAAQRAVRDLVAVKPDFPETGRATIVRWFDSTFAAHTIEGLRKAGLVLSDDASPAVAVQPPSSVSAARSNADEGFWVAVLPFRYTGSNADLAALAEGLSEEIVTGLSRFSYLRVMARHSTSRYAEVAADVRAVSKEIGARYVMEGIVRQAGSQLRVGVQLVDAATGAHLWAETYNRAFQPEAIFELQDDLVPRIVSTVADWSGALPRSMSLELRSQRPDQLSAYEAVLRSFGYGERRTPEEHATVRTALERAVQQAPGYADAWALLSVLHTEEYANGFNPQPDPLGRALDAARRAVDADGSNALGHFALARARFFRKEFQVCRTAAERALELNPMDGGTMAFIGVLLAYSGDWERGCAFVARATELNLRHPGWYWFPVLLNAYRKGDYAGALAAGLKINLPSFFFTHVMLAAVYGQLEDRPAADEALRELHTLRPDFAANGRHDLEKWYPPALVEQLIDGLRKAGLEIDASAKESSGALRATDSGARAAVHPSAIAVLPFANLSGDKEQEYFSDGLAEEIINLLAHVDGLRVIARTSSFAFRGKEQDVRRIADALDVTHVLEGSVRRAGDRIRVTAQLIAAADGGHVWSERFDKEVSDVFALQDAIAAAITQALRIKLSTPEAPRRYVPKLPAYEAYLRAKHHEAKVTPESLELAKACYESAIELDPAFALAHLGLGFYWSTVGHFGRRSAEDAAVASRAAAHAALRIDNSLPEAHALLGIIAAEYDLDWVTAERHFEAPGAREAGSVLIRPLYAGFLFLSGRPEQAVELSERAVAHDPLEVWPRMNLHAFLQGAGRDQEAYAQAQKALELNPNLVIAQVSIAQFHAAWGELAEAVAAARRAYEVGPWYPDARATLAALLRVSDGDDHESQALYQSLGTGAALGDCRAQAAYHLICGDIDTGADWTEKAIAERDFSMMYYLRFVVCKPLRASRRWPAIAKMVNLPEG